jgi:hypothetical protein
VHLLTIAISIRTNGNVIWLLVQMCELPQRDDDKEGGTEHGCVPGMAVVVLKL